MNVGIITGMVEEATLLYPGRGKVDPDMPFYLRDIEPGLAIACAGIGKVNGAMAACHLLDRGAELLMSVGVAGRLSNRPGECFWLREAVQHDYGAMRSGGMHRYRAGSLPFGVPKVTAFPAMEDVGLDLPHARIATGDLFIEHDAHSRALAETLEADLVDMETGAIAQVADRHRKPWAGIRAVSDEADDAGEAHFRENIDRAAKLAAHHAERFVRLVRQTGLVRA